MKLEEATRRDKMKKLTFRRLLTLARACQFEGLPKEDSFAFLRGVVFGARWYTFEDEVTK